MKTLAVYLSLAFLSLGAHGRPAATSPTDAQQETLALLKKVADWQLAQPPVRPVTDDWTYGALYAGIMALSRVAGPEGAKYHHAMVAVGEAHQWKPEKRIYDADDHCVLQTYLELYLSDRNPAMLAPAKERFDFILANPKTNGLTFNSKDRLRWTWCDALFMGPPAWVRMSAASGERKYLDFADGEWRATSEFLYDKGEHLYYRDSTYFAKREANGQKVFWSRGNGWVLAGLARVLEWMPKDYPRREAYAEQFKEMAEKVASLQQPDGLWHSSLLDPASYPLKESSGSGFYTFAFAWGVNQGLLPRSRFEPVVRKAWRALVDCVNPEGKLEHVQPIGADPKSFDPTHTDVFGTGAFLLAGSEYLKLQARQ